MPQKKSFGWVEDHNTVGKKVCAIFNKKYVEGEIVAFHAFHGNYKVRWKDGQTQIYNESDKEKGIDNVRRKSEGWLLKSVFIGIEVCAYFNNKLFDGVVTMYIPESKPGKKDQLYHILWEDYDEEDYDEQQFLIARDLFETKEVIQLCNHLNAMKHSIVIDF